MRATEIADLRKTLAVISNRSVLQLLVTANVVPSTPMHFIFMKGAMRYSETSVITKATRCGTEQDCIFIVTAMRTSYST
jgi:hypothetical protein